MSSGDGTCVSAGRDSREQLLLGVLGLELDLEAGGGDLAGVLPLFQQVLHGVAVLRVGRDELLAGVLQLRGRKRHEVMMEPAVLWTMDLRELEVQWCVGDLPISTCDV